MADGWRGARGLISMKMVTGAWEETRDEMAPYAHEENPVSIHRGIPPVIEDVRKPQQTLSIARRALWEHNDGTMCSFPHLLQALVFLLAVGGLGGNASGVRYHRPN